MREGDGNCVLCLLAEGELSDIASSLKVLVLSLLSLIWPQRESHRALERGQLES